MNKTSTHRFIKYSKRAIAALLCIMLLISLSACGEGDISSQIQADFDEYCKELFVEALEDDPASAHFLISDPSEYGLEYKDEDYTWGEISLEKIEDDISSMKEDLTELKKFDKSKLSSSQQLTYDTLLSYLNIELSYSGSGIVMNFFAPDSGIPSDMASVFIEYVLYDEEDAEQYLMLLKDSLRYMNDCLKIAKEQSEQGYFMSDSIADKVIEECNKFYNGKGEDIIEEFKNKVEALDISESKKENLIKTNKEYVEKYYLQAFKNAADTITELKGTGKHEGGLCEYGSIGEKYYEAIVKDKTSSQMTPKDMAAYLDKRISKYVTSLMTVDSDAYYETEKYQSDFTSADDVIDYIIENMNADFQKPVTTNYNIKNMSKSSENDTVGAYYVKCRMDNIEINNIKVNASSVGDDPLRLYQTLAHEAIPGHMYEYTKFYSDKNVSDIRKYMSFIGAIEGWAQYASYQAIDYLDISDDAKKIVEINSKFSYALMARVDVGVNYEGWDIEDTYDYLSSFISTDKNYDDEDNYVSMFYNMAVGNAGEIIPYAVGYMELVDLHDSAKKELGNNFSNKEFNAWFTNIGITSFDVYKSELDKWIKDKD